MFLFREVYCDVTDLVSYVLDQVDHKAPLSWRRVINWHSREIKQWLLVSSHLFLKLQSHGETVATDGVNHYWGRLHTAKPVFDNVITSICAEMQILEGQKMEWK